ncbi:PQQ-dependent sugar dehydrogenase [Azohydromonas aeria]|uniref:PQQ-dependent sugar dehydrogenase n=1 Tax=Azohydromonas aeria TaxID=2590212 RepID=UPI0012F8DDB3|nr:PQQ-dependent sugar dehydrogenase [Azohydromonas aeria]
MRDLQCAGEPVLAAPCSRRQLLGRFAGWGGAAGMAALLPGVAGAADVEVDAAALPPVRTLRTGLSRPWGLAFVSDGSLLVTEREGRLRRISASGSAMSTVAGLPPRLYVGGQGGLLDVQVDSSGGDDWVYLSYTERGTGSRWDSVGVAVARARLAGNRLLDLRVIFRARPKVPLSVSNAHYGSRLVLAPGNKLFISLADHRVDSERIKAQWLTHHHGKICRINRDGSVPGDNPFVGHERAQPEIWSLGHRNPQGLTLNPFTGELWESEHGPQGGDEINVIRRGANYGWPRVSHGCEYGAAPETCRPVGGSSTAPWVEPPVTVWRPFSIAPAGMCFYDGAMFPEWRGNLFVAALADMALWRLTVSGRSVTSRSALYRGQRRRMRDVRQAPDGALLVLTDEDNGRILRIAR